MLPNLPSDQDRNLIEISNENLKNIQKFKLEISKLEKKKTKFNKLQGDHFER